MLYQKFHFKVFLDKNNGKPAQFKIMPRFKVKAEGDVVSFKSILI